MEYIINYCEKNGTPDIWKEEIELYKEYNNKDSYLCGIPRSDPLLVQVVEKLGDEASGSHANLVITDIPKGTYYRIKEYDGRESIEYNDDNY